MNSPLVGKVEDAHAVGDRSGSSSLASTPEHEDAHEQDLPHNPEQQQQQKRKGGRKPIYATSEERKQRNRQAQAAFRERRTEYIKQLESTIKLHEETLQNLQQSHRSAADECLMLRYKNSLLERILLEKDIDVQAELRQKGGSPNLGPIRMPVSAPISQPIQRFAVNKFAVQNRRSLSGLPSKADGVQQIQPICMSPQLQPTSTSHISSPATTATKSPNFLPQSGQVSPAFGLQSSQPPQLRPQPQRPQFAAPQRPVGAGVYPPNSSPLVSANGMNGNAAASAGAAAFYQVQFQNHYDQLGKLSSMEYDAQDDMVDQEDSTEASAAPGPFPPPFANGGMPPNGMPQPQPPHMPSNGPNQALQAQPSQIHAPDTNGQFGSMNHMFNPYDPMLDADPFGLSASMHFPTQFQFDAPTR
ncbi:hypothetical protein EJ08DRAFT_584354 [Tothia fuscella]|uniref:BZIP domain-containing protein n=1 Tax=Tothia fuscella TaxID=1048955 RepID=A0A9P4U1R1_9PEZI|nr:hypothetical protein EJ08DRAFT_584354 [Tothia fuscella]